MKQFLLFFCLLLSMSTFAIELTCVHSIPTTSVTGAMEGEDFVVHIINHWGVRYMPLTTTPVSADDVERVIMKAKVFEKLGDHYIFRWKLKDWTRTDEFLISCSNGKEVL